ncbi:substrate-binding domain-containing protein [Paraburkholderia sediminicola]|uniref:Substrate-binding domain-containing protein n=1 Tax=Paraburkholderia rhynchosiae TaxID=487049 RepID=A0ACC7N527_9BURK
MLTLHKWVGMLMTCTSLFATATTHAADAFRVAYAGSMDLLMDRFIGPTFAKQNRVGHEGIGQGAYALARQLKGKLLQADAFISITPGPIDILKQANMIGPAVPVASTEMVIAYSPQSNFAPQLAAASEGKKPWYEVLRTPGLHFGRTDPATDPQGQNIIFTMLLAQDLYKQPGLAEQILGDYQNPQQVFAEPDFHQRGLSSTSAASLSSAGLKPC